MWPEDGIEVGEVTLQLRQIEHFEAVHRLRSFTRAAKEQYLSQSALSRSIRALEEELGQSLFDRTTHDVEPTDAASALIPHAVDVIAAVRQIEETARILRMGEGGSVAMGTGPYPAQPLMDRVVRSLSSSKPGLQVSVVGGAATELIGALAGRELDFVVCDISKAAESPVAEEIETVALPAEPLALVVGRHHPLVTVEPSPAEVATHPWVLPPPAPLGRRTIARSFADASAPRMPFYEVESTSTCLEVVQDQRSVTLVPLPLARRECPVRDLSFRLAGRGQATHDGLHVLRARTLSSAARIARDAVVAEASAMAAETAAWRRTASPGWQR